MVEYPHFPTRFCIVLDISYFKVDQIFPKSVACQWGEPTVDIKLKAILMY